MKSKSLQLCLEKKMDFEEAIFDKSPTLKLYKEVQKMTDLFFNEFINTQTIKTNSIFPIIILRGGLFFYNTIIKEQYSFCLNFIYPNDISNNIYSINSDKNSIIVLCDLIINSGETIINSLKTLTNSLNNSVVYILAPFISFDAQNKIYSEYKNIKIVYIWDNLIRNDLGRLQRINFDAGDLVTYKY